MVGPALQCLISHMSCTGTTQQSSHVRCSITAIAPGCGISSFLCVKLVSRRDNIFFISNVNENILRQNDEPFFVVIYSYMVHYIDITVRLYRNLTVSLLEFVRCVNDCSCTIRAQVRTDTLVF